MKRAAKFLIILAISWSLAPGLGEMIEQVWHVAAFGHGAHGGNEINFVASAEASTNEHDHEAPDSEHGCTGVVHVCGCHTTMASLSTQPRAVGGPDSPWMAFRSLGSLPPAAGPSSAIDHPPNA